MTGALCCPVTVTAEKKGPPRVALVAYTGGALLLSGHIYPVVLDLAGMVQRRRSVPLLRDHDMTRPVGHVTGLDVVADELHAAGVLSHAGKDREEIVASAGDDYPWQVSVGAEAAVDASGKRLAGAVEFLPAGRSATINGTTFTGPISIYRKWSLIEISILSLGADGNTSLAVAAHKQRGQSDMSIQAILEKAGVAPEMMPEVQAAIQQEADAEAKRATAHHAALNRICAGQTALLNKAISEGWTEEQAELAVLRSEKLQAKHNSPVGNPPITERQESPDVDRLLARYGFGEAKTAAMPPRRLVDIIRANLDDHCIAVPENNIDALVRAGLQMPSVRAGISSTTLPTVLEQFSRRVLETSYQEAPMSFWAFAKKIYLPDFRPQRGVRMDAIKNLEPITDGGEIKHGRLTEDAFYEIRLGSFAKLLRLTREDIINDDLGAFADLASSLARAAARTLSDAVYGVLLDPPEDFFSDDHDNLLEGQDAVLSVDSLAAAIGRLRTMRDNDGNDLDIRPSLLLVPPELELYARQLLDSVSVQWLGDSPEIVSRPSGNSLKGSLKIAVEPRLSNPKFQGADAKGWYLFADSTTAALSVAFLPGKDAPTVESFGLDQDVNTLAYSWRIYHDFGVALGDWRGVIKAEPK